MWTKLQKLRYYKLYARKWRKKNLATRRKYDRIWKQNWRKKHPRKARLLSNALSRAWRKKHPIKARRRDAIRRKKNRLKNRIYQREYMRKWRKKHPIINKRLGRKSDAQPSRIRKKKLWAKNHPNYNALSTLAWKEKHPRRWKAIHANARHRRRALLAQAKGSFTYAQFRALCKLYSYSCICCGRNERQLKKLKLVLVPDHIKPIALGGSNYIKNIQPLCHAMPGGSGDCNRRKRNRHINYTKTPLALQLISANLNSASLH